MNKSNHEVITKKALRTSGLHLNSMDLIAKANQDSDHQSAAASLDEQHFCGASKKEDQADGPLVGRRGQRQLAKDACRNPGHNADHDDQ